MHDFKFRNRNLYCESVKVEDVARQIGTPLYLYSHKTIIDHFRKLQSAFSSIRPLICYSMKANSNLAICRALVKAGAGLDIVSGGELSRAVRVGCPARKIVYASVGKTDKEIEDAIKRGILFFNVESLPELENINRIARRLNRVTNAAIRINPDVEPKTHSYITTGKLTNKFGIDFNTAYRILRARNKFPNIRFNGLHMHIGSQIIHSQPYVSAIKKIIRFIEMIREAGIDIEYLNIGGGLGIIYSDEKPQTAKEFAQNILPIIKGRGLKIVLEPGRFIVGNAGILVTKVLYLKKTPLKNFIIVDAGMNDLIRPSLYGAYHEIFPTRTENRKPKTEKVDVVGPICETGDFLAHDRNLPAVEPGSLLAVMSAGAYGFSMASNYNSRPRPAEVMIIKNKFYIIRKRESAADLMRGEVIQKNLR